MIWVLTLVALGAALHQSDPIQVIRANTSLASPPPQAPLSEWTSTSGRRTLSFTSGGVELRGWLYSAPRRDAPRILMFGGSGYAIATADKTLRGLAQQGADIITYDYRGYGFSGGHADVFHMRADALRLYDETARQSHGAPPILLGYSLGSIFASYVASQRHVRGLILISPLESTQAEISYLLKPGTYTLEPDAIEAQDVVDFVTRSHAPLLVLHGTADEVIPIKEGRADFEASAATDKSFVAVKGAGHAGMLKNPHVLAALRDYLMKLLESGVS
jgi:uncharacterized protein